MSIASEIQDLQTNLQAAKTAVTTKGGTVADTGLAGLASEIASIPSGGGPLASYGTVTYLDDDDNEQTVTMVSEDDFLELCNNRASGSSININNTAIRKIDIQSITIADGVTYLPDYFAYNCTDLSTLILPNTIKFIGTYFAYGAILNNKINFSNVLYIGESFMRQISNWVNSKDVELPSVEFIGDYFLYNSSAFNSNVILNNNCRSIGNNFMRGCKAFNKSLIIPAGLENVGSSNPNPSSSFLRDCDNFTGPLVCNSYQVPSGYTMDTYFLATTTASAPMYTTGITLTGPYAQNWKDALPDSTSSPYRKLTVGS